MTYSDGTISISNSTVTNTIVSQRITVSAPKYYRLSLEAKTESVSKGKRFADLATVALVYRDIQGDFLGNQVAFRLHGTHVNSKYTLDARLPKNTHTVDVAVRLLRATGQLTVSSLAFNKMNEFALYTYFVWTVSIASGIGLLLLLTHLALVSEVKTLLLVLASIGAIGLGTLMPGTHVTDFSKLIAESLPTSLTVLFDSHFASLYSGAGNTNSGTGISKLGHLFAFLILGIVSTLLRAKCGILFVTALVLYLAFATETFQALSLTRSSNLTDFYIDAISGILGLLIGVICKNLLSWKTEKHLPN